MPNYCNATIVLKGRKESVAKFIEYLKGEYCYRGYNYGNNLTAERYFTAERHFYRIFEVYEMDPEDYGMIRRQDVDIECAWSVYSCMFNGPLTYYDDCTMMPDLVSSKKYNENPVYHRPRHYSLTELDKMRRDAADHILHSTEILTEAERLGLQIEIKSHEPGMGFSEHYRINNGVLLQNEENEFNEYWCEEESLEKYEEEYGEGSFPGTEEEYNYCHEHEEYFVVGENDAFIQGHEWIYQDRPNLCKKVMCKVIDNSQPYKPRGERSKDFTDIAFREERDKRRAEYEARRKEFKNSN